MNYPNINILAEDKDDFEVKYICFLAKNISQNTYQDGGFLILPHLDESNAKSVFFPDLGYSKEFWKYINVNSNKNLSADFPKFAVDEVKKRLTLYPKNKYEREIQKIKSDWGKMEKEFFGDIDKFLDFGKALAKVEKINVLITPFGTRGSFNPPRVGNKFNLNVTSRVDCPAGNIASGILQNLYIIKTWIGGEIRDENYTKRMSAISFLMTSSIFNKYYPNFEDLTKPMFTVNRGIVLQSNNYLEKLGLKNNKKNLLDELRNLTKQEEKVLKELVGNTGNYVTFDKIGEILWEDKIDEKYSLSAMAKVMENLRRKIKGIGVNKEVIFTKRGKGYLFL